MFSLRFWWKMSHYTIYKSFFHQKTKDAFRGNLVRNLLQNIHDRIIHASHPVAILPGEVLSSYIIYPSYHVSFVALSKIVFEIYNYTSREERG